MRDCDNLSDLLPELVRGTLGPGARARVEAHLAGCASCRAEVAVLRAVRAAHPVPRVDVAAIVGALPRAPQAKRDALARETGATVVSLDAHRARRAASRVVPWRRVAGIAAVFAGVVTVGVVGGRRGGDDNPPAGAGPVAPPRVTGAGDTSGETTAAFARGTTPVAPPRTPAGDTRAPDGLGSLGGVTSDMTDDELEALLAGLETLSGIPDVEATDAEGADGGAA